MFIANSTYYCYLKWLKEWYDCFKEHMNDYRRYLVLWPSGKRPRSSPKIPTVNSFGKKMSKIGQKKVLFTPNKRVLSRVTISQ